MIKTVEKYSVKRNSDNKVVDTDDDLSALFDVKDDKKRTEFYMVFIGMRKLLLDTDLNGTDWRVLLQLCDLMQDGGWSDITQQGLAEHIGTFPANVNKSIDKLKKRGYITRERHPQSKRLTIRIRPEIAGCGGYAVTAARRAIAKELKKAEVININT